jgi:hypothetical protein
MTNEEIDDVVRALTLIVENLEAGPAKQSMQEAFTQVRARASAMRTSVRKKSGRQIGGFASFIDDPKPTTKQPIVKVS